MDILRKKERVSSGWYWNDWVLRKYCYLRVGNKDFGRDISLAEGDFKRNLSANICSDITLQGVPLNLKLVCMI